jgi:hypothetical protein
MSKKYNINKLWQIEIDIKPTNHKQICIICGEQLEKDKKRVAIMTDVFFNSNVRYCYAHINCCAYAIYKKFKGKLLLSQELIDELMVEEI